LKDLLTAIQGLTARVEAQDARLDFMADQRPPAEKLADLEKLSDAELQKLGLTRDDVTEAKALINEVQQDPDADEGKPGEGAEGQPAAGAAPAAAGAGAPAAAPAGAAAATGAALDQLREKVTYLEAFAKGQTEEQQLEAIETAFAVLDQKVTQLSTENEALRTALGAAKTTRLAPGVGEIHFAEGDDSKLTTFEKKVKQHKAAGKSEGEAVMLAQREDPEGHRQYMVNLGAIKKETRLG
jgi:hypothetical protein